MKINGAKINLAIRELYRLIMVVYMREKKCEYLDYDQEVMNLPYEPDNFDKFCEELRENIHPVDRDDFLVFSDLERICRILMDKPYTSIESRLKLYDKQYYWSEITFCRVDQNNNDQILLLIRDINDQKERNLSELKDVMNIYSEIKGDYDELFEENMRDIQTDCYNRKGLKYYTSRVLSEAREQNKDLFVCVLDLNGLKHINDTYGHDDGDVAIDAIASELKKHMPEGLLPVRTGGDEFLVFGCMESGSDAPDIMCQEIEKGLGEFNANHDYPYEVGASYGWVFLPVKEGMEDLDEYIEMADSKMYEMKKKIDKYIR